MTVLLIISCVTAVLYVLLMMVYRRGWLLQKTLELQPGFEPGTFISVIIPARNEEANIAACIDSVLKQNYPDKLYEIVVVDDHSEDGTAAIVKRYGGNVRYVDLAEHLAVGKVNAYKKAALGAGIATARGELIVTTDADCIAQPLWLKHLAACYEQDKPVMIVAPVIYSCDGRLVQLFQLIDFMSMQGITAAAQRLRLGNMSNGANLAFSRKAYEEVGGYKGTDHLATGDDYLLMVKMNERHPGKIAYLKSEEAIITTAPQATWGGFLRQRIRWASKSGKYKDATLTGILMLVYLFNSSLFALAIAGFFQPVLFRWLAGIILLKIIAELVFLVPVARFFGRSTVLPYHPLLQPLHIVYIVMAGFLGFVGGYEWKGRRVR